MITIGIDPGLAGAIGVLEDGKFVAVYDMPIQVKSVATNKMEVDPLELICIIKPHKGDNAEACLERVSAMPGQGVSSMFSLGDSFGCARSAIMACNLDLTLVQAGQWKRYFNLTSDKSLSLDLARSKFPDAELKYKKHADRAEALLISLWLYETKFK